MKRVEKYIEVFNAIVLNNIDAPNNVVKIGENKIPISYSGIVAERNVYILKEIFRLLGEKNYFVAAFLFGDLIENVKLLLYFLRGFGDEEKIPESLEKFDEWYKNRPEKKIADNFRSDTDWKFNAKEIIDKNKILADFKNETTKINVMNKDCDKVIHKNGYCNFRPMLVGEKVVSEEKVLFVAKFFFTLIVLFDGLSLRSSDYEKYLEVGETPPDGSEMWIAPIFQKFIDDEYSAEEKKKLQKLCYMRIE